MTFSDLISNEALQRALTDEGFTTPTPIQEQAIPVVTAGSDLLASAQTGTGKTAAFLLPALQKLATPAAAGRSGPRMLVLVPTRELAMQVAKGAATLGKHLPQLKTICIVGGAPFPDQNRSLSRPYDILVATPGRLLDHIDRGRIALDRLEILVLDEADRMLDMGFIDDVKSIAAMTPPTRQTLLFSATLSNNILKLSAQILRNPVRVSVAQQHATHDHIEQRLHAVDNIDHKNRILDHLLADPAVKQVIVFAATKHQTDLLADRLRDEGHDAAALHGDMRQEKRTRTINRLRQGAIRILVATDVAARGIDVPAITHVINFDLPMSVDDYIHRIGRTGRAGAQGVATSFAASHDMQLIRKIEQLTGRPLTAHVIPGLEPTAASRKPPRGAFRPRPGGGRFQPRPQGPQAFRGGRPQARFSKRRP